MKFSRVVFCDFDGTITTEDTLVSVLEKFAPEVSARLLPIIYERQMTLKAGIRQTLGSISSIHYPEIIEYIAHRPIRPGLLEFADFLNDSNIPLIVISGGLTDIVKAVLEQQQLIEKITAIHAAEVDTTGNLLRVYSVIESKTELVAKVKAMAQYPARETIAIGDSVTDINMALAADVVFARDRLVGYLDAEKKSYIKWHNFFDIRDRLARRWQIDI
jgi:2-hydroxy-3-keto-5-methylthiopentenyl-1-phosphate phosphatase